MPNHISRPVRAIAAVAALALLVVLVIVSHAKATSASVVLARASTSTSTTTLPATTSTMTTLPMTTTVATTTPATAPHPTAAPPPPAPVVPTGKGMWIYEPKYAEQGDPVGIVTRAQAVGLTHLYVRLGSSVDGFNNAEFLDALLPVAHANGLRIIGWDFPYLDDPGADATRAVDEISYTTPTGDRIDGFAADIETPAEQVALTPESATTYGSMIRTAVGPSYLLIATVPRPSPARQLDYPYADVVRSFDAIAPMVYWVTVRPDDAAGEAMDFLLAFGKPVLPVGQAYDSSYEGGTPGTPTPDELDAFINTSSAHGASGVSFWSWQHASDDLWNAIAAAPEVGEKPPG